MSNNEDSVKPKTSKRGNKKREIKYTFWVSLCSITEETLALDEIFDGTEDEWNAMTEDEKDVFLHSYLGDWLSNSIECGYHED